MKDNNKLLIIRLTSPSKELISQFLNKLKSIVLKTGGEYKTIKPTPLVYIATLLIKDVNPKMIDKLMKSNNPKEVDVNIIY